MTKLSLSEKGSEIAWNHLRNPKSSKKKLEKIKKVKQKTAQENGVDNNLEKNSTGGKNPLDTRQFSERNEGQFFSFNPSSLSNISRGRKSTAGSIWTVQIKDLQDFLIASRKKTCRILWGKETTGYKWVSGENLQKSRKLCTWEKSTDLTICLCSKVWILSPVTASQRTLKRTRKAWVKTIRLFWFYWEMMNNKV